MEEEASVCELGDAREASMRWEGHGRTRVGCEKHMGGGVGMGGQWP